jgi:hypothetical protein
MPLAGRRRSIAFFIALGIGLISFISLLYIGWVLLNWRTGILLFLGSLLALIIISGVVLNTTFLVREIRRRFTHQLKTPVATARPGGLPDAGAFFRTDVLRNRFRWDGISHQALSLQNEARLIREGGDCAISKIRYHPYRSAGSGVHRHRGKYRRNRVHDFVPGDFARQKPTAPHSCRPIAEERRVSRMVT